MKYKYNRKLGKVSCNFCNKEFEKPLSEIKRNFNKGRPNYCSRSCCGKKHVVQKILNCKDKYDISLHSSNRKTELTPFNYTFISIKRRFKEYNITPYDLKEQWEKQKGICTYSKIKLILPTYANTNIDIRYRASLDRIDSNKGYTKENIHFVSTAINYMKSTMSHKETIDFLDQILKNISCYQEDQTISSPVLGAGG
jgi:hypothetical protein